MKKATGLMLGALVAATLSTSSLAQTTITVSSWGGPNHGINTIVWPTWKAWIEEATEGRVTLQVTEDLGPPASQMALVADGVADASWIFHGHMAGRFGLTQLPEFPTFEDFSSEVASAAYWRTYREYLAQAEDREAIEAVSGERLSRLFGYMMDVSDRRGVEFAEELGNTFTQASEEDIAMLREVSDELIEAWAEKVGSGDLDAREALQSFRDQLAVAAEEESIAADVEQS